MLCRLLIVSMFALPFQPAMAGMITTDQALAASAGQANRNTLTSLLDRSDVAQQLQAQGVDPQDAKLRVAAMTDQEVASLTGQIQSLPAGGISGWWVLIIVGALVWYIYAYK
jgi:hypothetical protein